MSNENNVPRRAHLELNIAGERAIRDAILAVELHGCHQQLTEVVVMLEAAKQKLGDWYDSGAVGAPSNVSVIDQLRADPNISPALKAALTAPRESDEAKP